MRSEFELIVVFKQNVSEEDAEKLIKSFGVSYRNGMDSSRGKIYFYSTGPKYIITFDNEDNRDSFKAENKHFLPEIHEIYEPDWDKRKD